MKQYIVKTVDGSRIEFIGERDDLITEKRSWATFLSVKLAADSIILVNVANIVSIKEIEI